MEQIKPLDQITRQEWIAYQWIEIPPTMGDSNDDRMFRSSGKRTPDEAYQAMEEWDTTSCERGYEEEMIVVKFKPTEEIICSECGAKTFMIVDKKG